MEMKEAAKMYETENYIPQNRRRELNMLLNQRLADAVDLQLQMKQAHWNVKGPHFIGLHELFDKIDEAVESYVDLIAERIVQLGGIAEGTVRKYLRIGKMVGRKHAGAWHVTEESFRAFLREQGDDLRAEDVPQLVIRVPRCLAKKLEQ